MKVRLFFLSAVVFFSGIRLCGIQNDPLNIVFVHLGGQLPDYLRYTLIQTRLFNGNSHIYLVCEQNAADAWKYRDVLIAQSIKIVATSELTTTPLHQKMRQYYRAGPNFWDGYWIKTVERFYYLQEVAEKFKLDDLFHLENDTLIYFDIDEFVNFFRSNYKGIASIFNDEKQCMPCFMYFRNAFSLNHYLEFLTAQAEHRQEELSLDMHVPMEYMKKFGKDFLKSLPVIPKEYSDLVGLKNKRGWTAKDAQLYYENIDFFNSIFDAAALGTYLGGIDHRSRENENDRGPGYVHPVAMYDTSKFEYIWLNDSKNRKIPYIKFNEKLFRINNLHIHSKDLHKFISWSEQY